jgi:hypothetical protein
MHTGAITDPLDVSVVVEAFPAPLCDRCGIPKWLSKRLSYAEPPYPQLRLGYVCMTCGSETKLSRRAPVPATR